jgi:ribosomal protein S18 acetylase RimI-like enzyme
MREGASSGRDSERVGPFLATFNRATDNPYLNYAIPDAGAAPVAAEIEALISCFRARQRKPRLEYISALAPAVESALLAGGFTVEGRLPLMTCASGADVRRVVVHGVELVMPSSEDEYRAAASAQWEAYGESDAVPQRAVDALRSTADSGGLVVLARDAQTRKPAGAALCTPPHDGLTELTSVGVRVSFRRRGIAAAMAGLLAEESFANGATGVFLTAHGESEAARVYARVGFVTELEALYASVESGG